MAPLPDRRLLLGLLFLVVVVGALGFLLGRSLPPLFLPAPNADGLEEEERTSPRAASLVEEAKRAVAELIKGPQTDLNPTIPSGVGLLQLYFDGRGTASVDFTRDLQTK